jgi:two-component system, NarL family, invasion response regulator UvrY
MTSILIADDHSLIRQGLRKLFEAERDLLVTGEAKDAAEVLDFLSRTKVDLLILDINMPGRSGIEALQDVRKSFPQVRVLVLSMHPEEAVAVRVLRGGASGYVCKDAPPEELLKAIRKVAAGRRYVSQSLANRLAEEVVKPNTKQPHESLSEREYEVLCLIGKGKTVTEIARQVSLSVPSVATYRARILQKLNMKTTAELIYYAIRHNLVEPLG